jgi:hypothetical protein
MPQALFHLKLFLSFFDCACLIFHLLPVRPLRNSRLTSNQTNQKEIIMRMLMNVRLPHAPFNAAVKDGTAGAKLNKILEAIKPEAVYFTEQQGHRGAILIVDLPDASKIPALAEPWFMTFQADVEFRIVMTPDDLKKAGLDELGKKWS